MSDQFKQLVRVPNVYTHNPENNKGAYQKAAVWGSSDDDPKLNSYPLYYMDAEGNEQQLTTVDQSGAGQIYYAFVQNGIFTLSKDSNVSIIPYIKTDGTDDPVSFCLYDLDNGKVGNPVNNTFKTSAQYMQGGYLEVRNAQDIQKVKQRVIPFKTLNDAINENDPLKIYEGATIYLEERSSGNNGGGFWSAVLTSSVSPNTFNIVQCIGFPELSLVINDFTGYVDPLKIGASLTDKTKNLAVFQHMINSGVHIISHNKFEIDDELTLSSGTRINFLGTGGIYCSDGYLTSGGGKSLILIPESSTNIVIEGAQFNGNSGVLDFSVYPNTQSTGNEASIGLTRPMKLIAISNDCKFIKIKNCEFLNSVGDAVKMFGSISDGSACEFMEFTGCYWDLIRGNCIDGEVLKLVVDDHTVNLTGDIRSSTKGGLVVVTAREVTVSNIRVRQTTDSTIYLNGNSTVGLAGRCIVTNVRIRYSGKDAVKVLNFSDNSLFADIMVTAAGKTPIGFFGGTVANGVIGNIKIGYSEGDAPTDILDQADVTWSTPKTITACNIQEPKWDQGAGSGGVALAVADSSAAFSTASISSYTGAAVSCSASKVLGGTMTINNGKGPAIYATTSYMGLDNIIVDKTNLDLSLSPSGINHAIALIGASDLNMTSITFNNLGGGLIITGTDCSNVNIDNISGDNFDTGAGPDAHFIYLNSAASPDTVTDLNISNVSMSGNTTNSRIMYARNCNTININNWISSGGSEGLRFVGCSKLNLSNVFANDASGNGVRVSSTLNVSLNNVQGHDNGGTGVKTDSDCSNVIALGCQGSNNATNLSILGSNVKPATVTDFNIG